jgi:signal transduction histidine kinase/ActR/RegA family two-component response regulator
MRSSLSKKILFPTLITIALGLVAVLAVSSLSAHIVVKQELTRRLEREVQLTAKLIDSWLKSRMSDLVIWSGQEVFPEALTGKNGNGKGSLEEAQNLLAVLQKGYPFYDNIFLADRQGNVIAISSKNVESYADVGLADRPYFKETLQGKTVVSPIIISRFSAKKVFTITIPITIDGTSVGLIGGAVLLDDFKSLFLDDFKLKKHGYAFLTDKQQQVFASSRNNEGDFVSTHANNFLQRIAAGDKGVFTHKLDDQEIITVFQHLHWADWSFNLNQSLDETLRPLLQIGQVSFAGGLIVLIFLTLVISSLFRQLIVKRLRVMLTVIGMVKEGGLTHRIPEQITRPDEITELTDSFNTMIEQLDTTLTNLNQEIQVRKDTESALAHHQENLEKIIALRSQELEKEISERQHIEERLDRAEKMEMIGTLAGGVAHDLNNILSGIVTYPELLLMKIPADSPLAKPLQTIKESGEKASAIVQDLLTLARRGVSVKEPVNLNILLDEYLNSPEFKFLQSYHANIEIVTDCAPDLLPILGSSMHLAKTIMNLITNAAESMAQGGQIRLKTENRYIDNSLRLYEKIDQGEYVVLEVTDMGSGIKPEDLDRIFEPFYTTKKMGKSGTGLGMAVVWGTVKDHLGSINCESQVGIGTTFTLFFPVTSKTYQLQMQTASFADYQGNGEKILVIDDVVEQREIASTILTELGYQVATVGSGEEALELARQERFDLLLLDMILGSGLDGLDTYRQLLVFAPGQKAIITSGFSETERITEALRLGVGQYVKKPYMIAKLGLAIRKELRTEKDVKSQTISVDPNH